MLRVKLPHIVILFLLFTIKLSYAETIKILPIGDSITISGDGYGNSYRKKLAELIQGNGDTVDFIGTQSDTNSPLQDDANEGYDSHRSDQVLAKLNNWLTNGNDDVDFALIHLGTNDLLQNKGAASIKTNIEEIIIKLQQKNAQIKILVAKIIPLKKFDNDGDDATNFNALLTGEWTASNINSTNVQVVDLNTGMIESDYLGGQENFPNENDSIHPNNKGDAKMALKWFEALQPITLAFEPALPVEKFTGESFAVVAVTDSGGGITISTTDDKVAAGTGTEKICTLDHMTQNQINISNKAEDGDKCIVRATIVDFNKTITGTVMVKMVPPVDPGLILSVPTKGFVGDVFTVSSSTQNSSNTVIYASKTQSICKISGETVTPVHAGECIIEAKQESNYVYIAASDRKSIMINPIDPDLIIVVPKKAAVGTEFIITSTSKSSSNITYSSNTKKICRVAGTTVTPLKAGICMLKAKQAAKGDYTSGSEIKPIIISEAPTTPLLVLTKIIIGANLNPVSYEQLKALGINNVKRDTDYTKALKMYPYADRNKPTKDEIQLAVNKENEKMAKTSGSSSPMWLLFLGLITIYRRLIVSL